MQALENANDNVDQTILLALLFPTTNDDSDVTKHSIVKFCSDFSTVSFSDMSLTSSGQISVSWMSIVNPSVGTGVLAHEVGHVVSA